LFINSIPSDGFLKIKTTFPDQSLLKQSTHPKALHERLDTGFPIKFVIQKLSFPKIPFWGGQPLDLL